MDWVMVVFRLSLCLGSPSPPPSKSFPPPLAPCRVVLNPSVVPLSARALCPLVR